MTTRVIALHGFTGTRASFDRVRDALGDTAYLEALSLLGHEGTPGANSFDEEVDRLAEHIACRGGRPHLLGYSLGGRLALGLLTRHPSLFVGATIISAHPGLSSIEERSLRRQADARWIQLLEERGLEAFVREWEALPLFASQRLLPEAARAERRQQRSSHHPAGLARSLRVLGLAEMPHLEPELAALRVPITWLVGERDAKFLTIAERIVPKLQRARLIVAPQVGHDVVLESPSAVADAVGLALAPDLHT